MTKISIVIPTFARNKLLFKLIDSITMNPFFNKNIFELIIVDNNQNKEALEVVSLFNECKYLHEPAAGVSYARNAGANLAKSKYIYFLDDDEEIDIGTLKELLTIIDTEKEEFIYIGKTILKYEVKKPEYIHSFIENYLSKIDYGPNEKILNKNEWITAGNLLVRKETFLKIGGFNTSLQRVGHIPIGNEDIILKKEFEKLNIKTKYKPYLAVTHFIPKERLAKDWLMERAFYQGYSNFKFNEIYNLNKSEELLRKKIELGILFILKSVHLNQSTRFLYELVFNSRKGYFKASKEEI